MPWSWDVVGPSIFGDLPLLLKLIDFEHSIPCQATSNFDNAVKLGTALTLSEQLGGLQWGIDTSLIDV